MDTSIQDKVEYMIIFIHEFASRHSLSMKQAYHYLQRFKGVEFLDKYYGYAHTQSFKSMVEDLTAYCHRQGGALV